MAVLTTLIAGLGSLLIPLTGVLASLGIIFFAQDFVYSIVLVAILVFGGVTLFNAYSENASLNPPAAIASLLFGVIFFGIAIYTIAPEFYTEMASSLSVGGAEIAEPAYTPAGIFTYAINNPIPLEKTPLTSLNPIFYYSLWGGLIFLVLYSYGIIFRNGKLPLIGKVK